MVEPTAPPAPVVALESLPTSPMTRRRLLAGAGALGVLGLAGGLAATRVIGIGARPGDVLWQVRSGVGSPPGPALPSGALSPAESLGHQIVVDPRGRIIVARGTTVVGLDFMGKQIWSETLGGRLRLYPWGDLVLAASESAVWSLDPIPGNLKFGLSATDLGAPPQADGQPAQIGRIAVSESQAFVRLGSVTPAIDRAGRRVWPNPLPAPRAGAQYATSPLAADAKWLVTHDVFDATTHVGSSLRRPAAHSGPCAMTLCLHRILRGRPDGRRMRTRRMRGGRVMSGPTQPGASRRSGSTRLTSLSAMATTCGRSAFPRLCGVGHRLRSRLWGSSLEDLVLMAADKVYAYRTASTPYGPTRRGGPASPSRPTGPRSSPCRRRISSLWTPWVTPLGSAAAAQSS